MQIRYNGADIYQEVGVHACFHDMYAEKQADEILIQFTDTSHVWDGWKPGSGDTIEVIRGTAKTGVLYVESIIPEYAGMTLRASSIPSAAKMKQSKAWEQVRFSQIIQEIAGRWELSYETYSLIDSMYAYVSQSDQTDLEFLQQRCTLEGAAFLIYNQKLVVYQERELEGQMPRKVIEVIDSDTFEYQDRTSEACKTVTVAAGTEVEGQFTAPDGVKKLSVSLRVPVATRSEAQRYAKNVARAENKGLQSGVLYKDTILDDVAPGSTVELITPTARTWNGTAFVTHLRHDYVNGTSKLEFRKPLEGY